MIRHERSPASGFPAACRRFVAELAERAEAPEGSAPDPHAAECAGCRGRLAAARRQIALLRQLPQAPLPAAMRDTDGFLAAIYEQANTQLEAAPWAVALRAELGRPIRAPRDVAWVKYAGSPVELSLRRSLMASRTPGWLWQRIRSAVIEPRPTAVPTLARTAVRWAGLAAAAVLVALLLFPEEGNPGHNRGTTPLIDVVFQESDAPFDASFSLHHLIRQSR
jgi:hypothetical protein